MANNLFHNKNGLLDLLSSHIQATLLKNKFEPHILHDEITTEFDVMFKPNLHSERTPYIPLISCKKEIFDFIKKMLIFTKCEIEIVISMFILFKRILQKETLELTILNCKSLLFLSFYISQKVIDDISILDSEFYRLWPILSSEHVIITMSTFSKMEKKYLNIIDWDVNVSENEFYSFNYELYYYINFQKNYTFVKYPEILNWYPFVSLQSKNNITNVFIHLYSMYNYAQQKENEEKHRNKRKYSDVEHQNLIVKAI